VTVQKALACKKIFGFKEKEFFGKHDSNLE
jgi:hypothetical protein